jgi:hypothetical protein
MTRIAFYERQQMFTKEEEKYTHTQSLSLVLELRLSSTFSSETSVT